MANLTSAQSRLSMMLLLTTIFFMVEIIVGYITNSMALIADSFHMFSDAIALVIAFISVRMSPKKWSKNTFGWARAEILGALVNAVFLCALCVSILIESIKRFVKPDVLHDPVLILIVGGLGLFINLIGLVLFSGHHHHHHHGHGHGHHHHHHGHDHIVPANNEGDYLVACGEGDNLERGPEDKLKYGLLCNHRASTRGSQDDLLCKSGAGHSHTPSPDIHHCDNGDHDDKTDEKQLSKTKSSSGDTHHHQQHASSSNSTTRAEEASSSHEDVQIAFKSASADTNSRHQHHDGGGSCPESKGDHGHHHAHVELGNGEGDESKKQQPSQHQMNMHGVFLHVMADALGSVIVMISALVVLYTDWNTIKLYIDPTLSVFMVCLILRSTWPLLTESAMILLQTVPTHIEVDSLRRRLTQEIPGVLAVHEFHVWQLAGDRIIASAHIRCHNLQDYMRIAEKVKEFFHNEGIHSTTIQPEFLDLENELFNNDAGDNCVLDCPPTQRPHCAPQTCCGNQQQQSQRSEPSGIAIEAGGNESEQGQQQQPGDQAAVSLLRRTSVKQSVGEGGDGSPSGKDESPSSPAPPPVDVMTSASTSV